MKSLWHSRSPSNRSLYLCTLGLVNNRFADVHLWRQGKCWYELIRLQSGTWLPHTQCRHILGQGHYESLTRPEDSGWDKFYCRLWWPYCHNSLSLYQWWGFFLGVLQYVGSGTLVYREPITLKLDVNFLEDACRAKKGFIAVNLSTKVVWRKGDSRRPSQTTI